MVNRKFPKADWKNINNDTHSSTAFIIAKDIFTGAIYNFLI